VERSVHRLGEGLRSDRRGAISGGRKICVSGAALKAMAEKVRLRVVFEDRGMLCKSKKKEGLKRCWFLL